MKKEQANVDFIALEKEVLEFWEREKCFEKLVEKNKAGKRFRFLDGPITANNPMGIHHAWGRTLKDLYIKYNAMQGKSCQYQNGFDAQGLWVEVEVEKEAGIKAKCDIIDYGLDKFTEKCIGRVKKFSGIITEQSKRLGQWMDWENSYYTNSDTNITSIWHFLKKCNQNGWLVKSHRPMPWCPRCGTSLSEHEMSGSYADLEHLSIFSMLPIKGTNDSIMLWTTTPWTLSSNVALAVNPEIDYCRVKVKSTDRTIIIGKKAVKKLAGDIIEIVDEFKGSELLGKEYETCFNDFEIQQFPHTIIAWEDVDAEEGTGIVHIAPGCGSEDFELGKKLSLPMICPIDDEGIMMEGFGELSGKKTTKIIELIVNDLKKQGKLYKTEMYSHSYPHCWRCKTEVVFKLVDEWYISTAEIKPRMIRAVNEDVKWEPEYAKKRMLDWLNNMGDWNISRKRFYGLPLPFYPCKECGHLNVIGSKEELKEKSEKGNIDGVPHLHRPYIDEVKVKCEKCGSLVERIPEVGDCWLDAGITPFSTKEYFTDKEYFANNFPSELIIEMKEQIRLWFYSLLFMSVTLEDKAPYENVVAHSSVIKEDGGKFSKTGVMIRFDEAAEKIGADPVRYLFSAAPVNNDVRFGYGLTDEARRKILGFWNVYVFFNLYASIDNPQIANFKVDVNTLTHSDKWILTRTNAFIKEAKKSMDAYKPSGVIKEFESFVDDMSNWYIRINRKRFWKSTNKIDQMNAYYSLYVAIKAAIQIMAPITPFFTDYIWQNLVRAVEPNAELSVHHSTYPEKLELCFDDIILKETEVARYIIAIGQRMRNESQIKIKQPLSTLYMILKSNDQNFIKPLLDVVKDELNVKEIVFAENETDFNDVYFTVNFRVAGAVLKKEAQKLKSLVDELSQEGYNQLFEQYKTGRVTIGEFSDLSPDCFDMHYRPKSSFVVQKDKEQVLALDITLTKELIAEGRVRELIRQIQIMRKEADFAVEQRITACITTSDKVTKEMLDKFIDKIKEDILASEIKEISAPDIERDITIQDVVIKVSLKR